MKIGFVIPWYGVELGGGAETECRATVLQLRKAGIDAEVITTCVKDFRSDWNQNYYSHGLENLEGVPVHRFKIRKSERYEFHRINQKLMDGDSIGSDEEKTFLREMIRSDDLVKYMERNKNKYVYIPIPYMFGTTYFGTLACSESCVLLPCLHDESYAYMNIYKEMFRSAKGIIFNAKSEQKLAENLYDIESDKGALIGMGMDFTFSGNSERFKIKYQLDEYILYVGRKDEGKNLRLLIHYFCIYKEHFKSNLKLVLIGGGKIDIPEDHLGIDIIDLGFVPMQDKWDAMAGALALCNPSLNESFSIVLMEAWICGTSVLVHEDCSVTRDHCLSSQGGLYFSSFEDFAGCIEYLVRNPEKRKKMALNGEKYVKANYSWQVIIQKYRTALARWGFQI